MSLHSKRFRVATFNIGLDQARNRGELKALLKTGDFIPAQKSAQIIQHINPDILLINEIDGNDDGEVLKLYLQQYLGQSQADLQALQYPFTYQPNCNTGVSSGISFRGLQSEIDNYGFGYYDGQYCMAVLSKYPIAQKQAQSFQKLLWKSMPGALLPLKNGKSWYSMDGLEHFRLSSKNHVDIPVEIYGQQVHLLISHPTPPVFDGDEDRNGKRNHDEIIFWKHYINGQTSWMRNDNGQTVSGLGDKQRFIILGDLNASTVEGDATIHNGQRAITSLLHDPLVASGFSELEFGELIPKRTDWAQNSNDNGYNVYHTADWGMRADYVVPSKFGLKTLDSGVYWPCRQSTQYRLITGSRDEPTSSDHRLVWLDLEMTTTDTNLQKQ